MKIQHPSRLIFSIIICQLAGVIGGFFTSKSVSTWYTTLNKPSFNPPSWLFSPVWITLYLLMGISLYLIWTSTDTDQDKKQRKTKSANNKESKDENKNKKNKKALTWFYAQLGLNTLWSILFFGLRQPLLSFIEIIVLDVAIFMTMVSSYKLSKTATYLFIPYTLWVTFAAILNFSLWYLN